MKNILLTKIGMGFILICLGLTSCKKDIKTITETNPETKEKLEYQIRISDEKKHGTYKLTSAKGVLIETAQYQDGELDGERLLFFENGEVQYREQYKQGQFEGPYFSYFDSGSPESEGQYVENAMQGEWKFYYSNGQVKEILRFTDNEENGPFLEYHENGKMKAEGQYLKGDYEEGELKLYDEQGELERIMNCDKGICRTQWVRDTTTIQ